MNWRIAFVAKKGVGSTASRLKALSGQFKNRVGWGPYFQELPVEKKIFALKAPTV